MKERVAVLEYARTNQMMAPKISARPIHCSRKIPISNLYAKKEKNDTIPILKLALLFGQGFQALFAITILYIS
jgi:hypothetical protein